LTIFTALRPSVRGGDPMTVDRQPPPKGQRQRNSQRKAAEAERVEGLKRAQIAKFSTSIRPEIAKALVDAVYSVFPPPPKKKAPVPRKDN
jgi:hypothetical protein